MQSVPTVRKKTIVKIVLWNLMWWTYWYMEMFVSYQRLRQISIKLQTLLFAFPQWSCFLKVFWPHVFINGLTTFNDHTWWVLIAIRNISAVIMRDSWAFKLYKVIATFLSAANALFLGEFGLDNLHSLGLVRRSLKKIIHSKSFTPKLFQRNARC